MEADISSTLQSIAPQPIRKSYLQLVDECDNFPYDDVNPELYLQHISTYYQLFIPPCTYPLGYLLPSVALTLRGIDGWAVDESEKTLTLNFPKLPPSTLFSTGETDIPANEDGTHQTDEQQRSAIFARTTTAMRATGHFEVLKKWRDELYPIYWRPPQPSAQAEAAKNGDSTAGIPRPRAEILASVERSASPLFGIVTYGCHMTAYVNGDTGLEVWVPRRSSTKGTYPGMLDQTVAGGIASGETPWESLVREAAEEASLPEELVRRKTRSAGTVSYFHVRDERAGGETRLLQPECQFVYDLDLTGEDVLPRPGDDEVEGFELMSVQRVRDALTGGEFKPNCAVVLLDFLIRHGHITEDDTGDYVEICARLHRRLEFPTM